jgi:hypothetical protein
VDCVSAGCAWAIGLCQDNCDNFPLPCYSLQGLFDSTPESICQFQQKQASDRANCGIQTTCESCTSTVLTAIDSAYNTNEDIGDGEAGRTCSWYDETQTCSNLICDSTGCSTPYCRSSVEGECYFGASNCNTCLELTTSTGQTCSWSSGTCELECKPDIACYNPTLFGGTTEQICAAADVAEADANTCLSQPDCASCTAALKTDGTSCEWYYDGVLGAGWCAGGGCDATGVCGVTSCEGIPDTSTVASDCLGLSTLNPLDITCEGCLASECGWTTVGYGGGQCLASCSAIADAPCYVASSSATVSTQCAQASADAADTDICRAVFDCTSCISTLKSDRVSTCAWYGNVTDATLGYCGSGLACDQNGNCPSTTCDGASGGLCSVLNTCSGCLNNPPCVWIGDTCQVSCEAIPGETCYTDSNPEFAGQFSIDICNAASGSTSGNRDIIVDSGGASARMTWSSVVMVGTLAALWSASLL